MSTGIRPDHVAKYIRWSTDDQGKGTTLEEQLEGTDLYIRSQGWLSREDLTFVDDGYSGGNLDRPALTRLRELVQQGEVDCVVVLKIDRLSRNIVDAVELVLREWDGKCYIKSAREPIDTTIDMGRMIFGVLAMFADYERQAIRERTLSGRKRRAAEGRNAGMHVPYGLKFGANKGDVDLVPYQLALVREMAYQAEAMGVYTLAQWANAHCTDRTWRPNQILQTLRNPIYLGLNTWGAHKGRFRIPMDEILQLPPLLVGADRKPMEPVIPFEQFRKVQQILDDRKTGERQKRPSGRTLSSGYLLSGIAKCRCGGSIMGVNASGRPIYTCSMKRQRPGNCSSSDLMQHTLDAAVLDEIRRRLADGPLSNLRTERLVAIDAELQRATAMANSASDQARRYEREASQLLSQRRREEITIDEYREFRAAAEEDLRKARAALKEATADIERLLAQRDDVDAVYEAAQKVAPAGWESLSASQRKHVLMAFVRRLVIFRETQVRRGPNRNPIHIEISI